MSATLKRTANGVKEVNKRAKYGEDELVGGGSGSDEEESGSDDGGSDDDDDDDDEDEDEEDDDDDEDEDDDEDDPNDSRTVEQTHTLEQKILAQERKLGSQMKADRAKVVREGGLGMATDYLKHINAIFQEKEQNRLDNKTLELYDARNFADSGDLVDIAVRNIKVGTTDNHLKPDDFIKRMRIFLLGSAMKQDIDANDDKEAWLQARHSFEQFNWLTFGTLFYSRGMRPGLCDHLLGPLDIEKKVREVRVHQRLVTTDNVTTAEEVTSDDVNNNATDHTTLAVQNAFKVFCQKSRGEPVNIFKFFINPTSFPQSVENMFYTSFLLKDGRIKLDEDPQGYPTISLPPPLPRDPREAEQERQRRVDMNSNHFIFQLEYSSWKLLIDKFNITESFIPTRQEDGVVL